MRRFTIGKLMFLVALLAANIALVRWFVDSIGEDWALRPQFLLALMPLFGGLALAFASIFSRFRVSLGRRDKRDFALAFAACASPVLVATLTVLSAAPGPAFAYVSRAFNPVGQFLYDRGFLVERRGPGWNYLWLPVTFWLLIAFPLLLLSLGSAMLVQRYRVALSPRGEDGS